MDISMEEALLSPPHSKSPSPEPPSSTGRPLTEFTLFPKLIIELRLRIWDFCFTLQAPRLVEVRTQLHDCDQHKGWCPRFSACRVPTLVHVSPEARMVAREQAQRAGHLCFGTLASPPNVFFNPEIDRLYLPVEKEPWMRDADEQLVRARRRHAYQHGTYQQYPNFQPSVVATDDSAALAVVPTTTLFQFKKCHKPASVRFLVTDLDIRPGFMPHDPVWTVMQEFLKLQELVFVVPEHVFAYAALILELARVARMVQGEKVRWENASKEGVVGWDWPTVRVALRCKGALKFVELEGPTD